MLLFVSKPLYPSTIENSSARPLVFAFFSKHYLHNELVYANINSQLVKTNRAREKQPGRIFRRTVFFSDLCQSFQCALLQNEFVMLLIEG